MAEKKKQESPADESVNEFLQLKRDAGTVHHLDQSLEIHISGKSAYFPTYTRRVMDEANGAPIQAVYTKTNPETKKFFIYAAADPQNEDARKLNAEDSLGPARFGFAVPMRILQLKPVVGRRLALPLHSLEVPGQGTVYWASFAEIEKGSGTVDREVAAAKQATAKAKKSRRRTASDQPQP